MILNRCSLVWWVKFYMGRREGEVGVAQDTECHKAESSSHCYGSLPQFLWF